MLNFSMLIKGTRVSSSILEEVVELLPKSTHVSVFSKDESELNSELVDAIQKFGFTTDAVIGQSKKESAFISFKRMPITPNQLIRKAS